MPLLYSRTENEKEITIVFKYLAFRMYVMLLFLVVFLLSISKLEFLNIIVLPITVVLYAIVVVVFLISYWKPTREMRLAMRNGKIQLSGSRWSLKNPLTAVISK